jgi:hypothetical protein
MLLQLPLLSTNLGLCTDAHLLTFAYNCLQLLTCVPHLLTFDAHPHLEHNAALFQQTPPVAITVIPSVPSA